MLNMRFDKQSFILGSLVVLWVGVLPFLCWGGWSNPHHPHASPHFVFAKPPLHDTAHHHEQDDASPAGVAHPDTLLITLLVLLMPVSGTLLHPHYRRTVQKLTMLLARTCSLAVPTPPPRILCAWSADKH
ncbi:MAG: hypothetical protein IT328_12240 [Caldilineaceae bacterium]|nr:hypothetical protein [Caldilineaceae bacterium]